MKCVDFDKFWKNVKMEHLRGVVQKLAVSAKIVKFDHYCKNSLCACGLPLRPIGNQRVLRVCERLGIRSMCSFSLSNIGYFQPQPFLKHFKNQT